MTDGDRGGVHVEDDDGTVVRGASRTRVSLQLRLSRFGLPPVQSALLVGKRALIGARAFEKALAEMMPGTFERIDVEHPIVEAILVRKAHLRRVSRDRLVPMLLRQAEQLMAETESLHVDMSVEVQVDESFEV